jgi:hypothetical protein
LASGRPTVERLDLKEFQGRALLDELLQSTQLGIGGLSAKLAVARACAILLHTWGNTAQVTNGPAAGTYSPRYMNDAIIIRLVRHVTSNLVIAPENAPTAQANALQHREHFRAGAPYEALVCASSDLEFNNNAWREPILAQSLLFAAEVGPAPPSFPFLSPGVFTSRAHVQLGTIGRVFASCNVGQPAFRLPPGDAQNIPGLPEPLAGYGTFVSVTFGGLVQTYFQEDSRRLVNRLWAPHLFPHLELVHADEVSCRLGIMGAPEDGRPDRQRIAAQLISIRLAFDDQ